MWDEVTTDVAAAGGPEVGPVPYTYGKIAGPQAAAQQENQSAGPFENTGERAS